MRIQFICPFPPEIGGVAYYCSNLVHSLRREGHEINVLSRSPGLIGYLMTASHLRRELSAWKASDQGSRWKPHAIHIHSDGFFMMPWLPILASLTDIPVVVTAHEVLMEKGRRIYARGTGVADLLISTGVRACETALFQAADLLVFHNEASRKRAVRSHGLTADKARIIPHGVDTTFHAKTDFSSRGDILFAGYLTPHKGLDVAILAVEELLDQGMNCKLLVVGTLPPGIGRNGTWFRRIASFAHSKLSSEHVRFLGYQDEASLRRIMVESDVIVLPYEMVSGSGVLARAMAHGLPIIASRIDGFENDVQDEQTGLLVEPGNPMDLAQAISRLYEDESLRRRLGLAARAHAEKNLDWRIVGGKHLEIYERVIS